MVKIKQHGQDGQLFDFNTFIADSEQLRNIEKWQFKIHYCLGLRAEEVEKASYLEFVELSAKEFVSMHKDVYQTIDGEFIGLKNDLEWCRLLAVDSSYWEVTGPNDLEAAMLARYGAY